jgi:nicotinamide-nucleotide amidase
MFKVEIIAIGDELLIGQVLNTNAQWLAQELNLIGLSVVKMITVSDTKEAILDAVDEAFKNADFIFITGGLGPTKDDITKHTLCEYFDTELVLDEQRLQALKDYFEKRLRIFNELNISQAMHPKDCYVVNNEVGTACGMWFKNKEGKNLISMPGVPYEMKDMMKKIIIPKIKEEHLGKSIQHRTIRTFGVGESTIAEKINDWENQLPEYLKLAYLPNIGQVRLRLSGIHDDVIVLSKEIGKQTQELRSLVADAYYGEGEDELEDVVGRLLTNKKLSLATAESCTGGYLAHKISSVAGCSNYYKGSVVAYSNEVKVSDLNVLQKTLDTFGAVSEETVKEMSQGLRGKYNTDFALSTSGIAGPSGGTEEKPVGTIWIALSFEGGVITKKLTLGPDRGRNIHLTALFCLDLLRRQLLID